MTRSNYGASLALLLTLAASAALGVTRDAPKSEESNAPAEADKADAHHFEPFKAESVTTSGSVTIGGRAIGYQAIAGTLIVHPKGWDDVPRDPRAEKPPAPGGSEEMHHLPIPQNLQANIEYCFYESGHMVYAKDASLRQLHDNVAEFIRRTGRTAQ